MLQTKQNCDPKPIFRVKNKKSLP